MEFKHIPVLFEQTIDILDIKPNGIYIDGTAGGAGHSTAIAKKLKGGRLFSLDRDPDAVAVATKRLEGYPAVVVHCNYNDMDKVIAEHNIDGVDGILLDLGVSSFQLDTAERGFSYHNDAPLDMRMSKDGLSAKELVNTASYEELTRILREYGEEKFASRIANAIIREREIEPIENTLRLSDVISNAVPAAARRAGHPARKSFQAIRIAVNDEIEGLKTALKTAFDCLKPNGILAVITFHSLEDRIVKQYFASLAVGCTCPPELPVCVCGNKPKADVLTRKPIEATSQEVEQNQRSRSAKLRAVKKKG